MWLAHISLAPVQLLAFCVAVVALVRSLVLSPRRIAVHVQLALLLLGLELPSVQEAVLLALISQGLVPRPPLLVLAAASAASMPFLLPPPVGHALLALLRLPMVCQAAQLACLARIL